MKLQKRLSALVLSVLLLGGMCVNVRAHDVPDISRKGSISVEMTYEDQPVPGGAAERGPAGRCCRHCRGGGHSRPHPGHLHHRGHGGAALP